MPYPCPAPSRTSQEDVERGHWAAPSESDIVSSYCGSGARLRPEDVIVCETKINYGMRSANPLDSVHFFDHWDSTEKRGMRHHQITSMMAAAFQVRPATPCCCCCCSVSAWYLVETISMVLD